jgi:hypothetical protein
MLAYYSCPNKPSTEDGGFAYVTHVKDHWGALLLPLLILELWAYYNANVVLCAILYLIKNNTYGCMS